MCRLCAFFALLVAGPAMAAPFERGVEKALVVHVPPGGLATVGDAVRAVVPPTFPILAASGTFDCSDTTTIAYTLADTDLLLTADEVAFDLAQDRVDVTLYATLDSTASTLDVTGDCSVLEDLDETCTLQIPTTAIEVTVGLTLVAVGGQVDAIVDDVVLQISPITNPVSGCLLESAVGTLLGQNPMAINDLLLGAVEPSLADLPLQIETALEDALNSFAFTTTVDLLGTPLGVSLAPTRLDVSAEGLTVGLGATFAAEAGACADPATVAAPTPEWPLLAGVAEGTSLSYDAGVLLGRDFVDEALVAAWGAGLLCMELSTVGDLQLVGALLGPFFGEEVGALVESDTPATIVLSAPRQPTTRFDEDQPALRVGLDDLALDLVSTVDYRQTRIVQVGIDAEVGLDLGLVDGTIAPSLVVDPGTFVFSERYSDLVGPGYTATLGSFVETLLGVVVPTSALATVALPAPLGIEIDELFWRPNPDEAWLGGYAVLDLSAVQPIAVAGCQANSLGCGGGSQPEFDVGQALGCDDPEATGCSGDGGACATGALSLPAWPGAPLVFLGALVAARRRRA